MSRLYETQFGYILTITALRLTAIKSPLDFFSVLLMVTPLVYLHREIISIFAK